jgi:ubiquitin carboxyl-terminal hydrolase 20/33
VVQNQRKTLSKNFNNSSDLENGKMKTFDLDSGISSISNKSSAKNGHIHLNGNSCSNSGDESIDSFETCGEDADTCLATTASSDLSEKLHFSDADETLPPPVRPFCETNNSSDKNSLQECKINKKAAKSDQKSENSLPKLEDLTYEKTEYSSIVSELFDGKLISQVQCLECNHFSTTTETFQHLSLPIPSKEYLQSLHNKILNSKNKQSSNLDDEDDDSPGESQQGWLSWMADIIKGYLWNTTIKLTECLTAFFSDDDLKGDNMYSCEKCKK